MSLMQSVCIRTVYIFNYGVSPLYFSMIECLSFYIKIMVCWPVFKIFFQRLQKRYNLAEITLPSFTKIDFSPAVQ